MSARTIGVSIVNALIVILVAVGAGVGVALPAALALGIDQWYQHRRARMAWARRERARLAFWQEWEGCRRANISAAVTRRGARI